MHILRPIFKIFKKRPIRNETPCIFSSASPERKSATLPVKKNIIEGSDSDDDIVKDEDTNNDDHGGSLVCDFDIMMQKKKEENRSLHNKRRKNKDIDMINDNDDAIAKVL